MEKRSKFIILLIVVIIAIAAVGFTSINYSGFVIKTGQFTVGNTAPAVENIYLNSLLTTDTAGDVIIDPAANTTKNISVTVMISDTNGDCNTFTSNNATVYLCNGTAICHSATADHTVQLSYNSTDGQWGPGNRYCNMTGTAEQFQFFEINGSWGVNATITDGINTSAPLAKDWTYNELSAFSYAESGTIFMGALTLSQWNNGTGQEGVKNTGNIVIDLGWNATNFTGNTYGQKVNITGDNYIIDDDAVSPDDTANIPEVYINETFTVNVTFVPSSGLVLCENVSCFITNATFDVYWHIDIPSGILADTYENAIEVASTRH